jgi:hypothetical protein
VRLRRCEIRVQYRPDLHRQLPLPRLQESLGRRDGHIFRLAAGRFHPGQRRSQSAPLYRRIWQGLDRNFCPECGARLFTSNLESFPGLVFVMLGSLDRPELIEPKLEMFTKRRLKWAKPLDLPQFDGMPS